MNKPSQNHSPPTKTPSEDTDLLIDITIDDMSGFFVFAESLDVSYIFFRKDGYEEVDAQFASIDLSFITHNNGSVVKVVCSEEISPEISIDSLFCNIKKENSLNFDPDFIPGCISVRR